MAYQNPKMAEAFKGQMSACEDADQRRACFLLWAQDMTFPRSDICLVLKELKLSDDMEFIES